MEELMEAETTKSLDEVIAESRAKVEAAAEEKAKKTGRPAKYSSEEERREARRAQNRAYKASKTGKVVSEDGRTIEMEREDPPFRPTPAGMQPLLERVVDMPVYRIRQEFKLSPDELPGFDQDPEAKKALVEQADLVVGTFCPNVVNNKWALLGSFIFTAGMMYWGIYSQAADIAAAKRGHTVEDPETDGPAPEGPLFPVIAAH